MSRQCRDALSALTVAVVALTACGSTDGAQAADPTSPAQQPAEPTLDAGNYPTKPLPPLGPAGANGSVVEGQRMAEFVIGPWEVDPALVKGNPSGSLVVRSAQALNALLLNPAAEIAARNNFVVGFSANRSADQPPGAQAALTNAVLRFATPENAAAAASEFSMQVETPPGSQMTGPAPIPGHAEAMARGFTLPDGAVAVESFVPHGIYVLYNYARAQDGNAEAAALLTARAIELQKPRIDEFVPTDPAKLAELPADPTGLLARTLPVPPESATVIDGAWQPHAWLFYQPDPLLSSQLFADAGVTAVAKGAAVVFEARDAAGAQRLFDGFDAGQATGEQQPIEGVAGLDSAKCFNDGPTAVGTPQFSCAFVADRYMVNVFSRHDVDVQQRAAAQYLMLTAK